MDQPYQNDFQLTTPSMQIPPLQGGIEDEPLKGYHFALIDKFAGQSQARNQIDQRIGRAMQGEDWQTQNANDEKAQQSALTSNMVADTAHLNDDQFNNLLGQLHHEIYNAPMLPQQPKLQAPNIAQSGLAFLGSLLSPRNAYDIAATPFQAQLQKQATDYAHSVNDYQLQAQEHQRKLGLLGDVAQMQSQRDITQANLTNDGLSRDVQQRGQDMTFQRSLWNDLNTSKSSVLQLKSSIAALEGAYHANGWALPANWDEVKHDLTSEAETNEREVKDAKAKDQTDKLVQKYLVKASDPMADPNAKMMNAQIAAMLMPEDDPKRAYLEQIMPGIGQWSLQQKKMQAEIGRIFTQNSNDTKLSAARIQEVGTRREAMRHTIKLTDARAAEVAKQTAWMDSEKSTAIAKGWASIDLINDTIKKHGLDAARADMRLNQQAWIASNQNIASSMRTLSAQMNTLRAERGRLEALQQTYSPGDQEYKDLAAKIGAIDSTLDNKDSNSLGLTQQYNRLQSEADKIKAALQAPTTPNTSGGATGASPKPEALTGFLRKWTGTPYKWGGSSEKGIDCSAYATRLQQDVMGTKAHGTTLDLLKQGEPVSPGIEGLQPGDILFFKNSNGTRHCITYIGNGMVSEASTAKGVVTRPLSQSRYDNAFEVRRYK